MRCRRLTSSIGLALHRSTVFLGLVAFVSTNVGIPLVQPTVAQRAKDKSKSFPCQDRPCGCMSADECMRSCCCFTASERLAWANAHHVEPPRELIAAAARETSGETRPAASACCAKESKTAHKHDACGDHKHHDADCEHGHDHDDAEEESWGVTFVIGSMAAKCRGLGPLDLLVSSALPPTAAVGYHFDWSPLGWIIPQRQGATSLALPPPTRPPWA